MKTLNLVDIDKSDIKYQLQNFPDGQQNIVLDFNIFEDIRANNKIQGYSHQVEIHRNYEVQIKSRLNSFKDLELIICAVACLRECQVPIIHLYTPYIMGARSDRKFEEGGNNYLKDVISPIINSLNFKTVICIDPYSDVLEACIKGFRKEYNTILVHWALLDLYPAATTGKNYSELDNFILISPDAGANKKIYKLAEQIGYKGDIITCSKDRDTNGNLTKTEILLNINHDYKDFIIIDDICDGGNTFINIAKKINEYYEWQRKKSRQGKIYLIVTHGIFSAGFKELSEYFDGIYCTNSYQEMPDFKENNLRPVNLLKQLNVF